MTVRKGSLGGASRLRPLHLADVSFPGGHPRAGTTGPVYAFLILHPLGPILVDTGIGPQNPLIDRLYRPVRSDLAEALARFGFALGDIRAVVNTHLHFDHCGGNQLFPGTPIFVQRLEMEDARGPDYTMSEWVQFSGADYRLVDGEREIAPGVRTIPTPGHTRGHESVAVETAEGLTIICGQAAETAAEFDSQPGAGSLSLLRELQPARVVFSHDDSQWAGGLSAIIAPTDEM